LAALALAGALGFGAIRKPLSLDAWRQPRP
jgi:hypothetical protein